MYYKPDVWIGNFILWILINVTIDKSITKLLYHVGTSSELLIFKFRKGRLSMAKCVYKRSCGQKEAKSCYLDTRW